MCLISGHAECVGIPHSPSFVCLAIARFLVVVVIRFHAGKARGTGRAPLSLVLGKLRERTKRPLERHALRRSVIYVFRRHDFIGRFSPFDPLIESRENVVRCIRGVRPIRRTELTESVCAGSSAAVRHSRHHEETIEVLDSFVTAQFLRHRMMVVDVVDRRDGGIAPADIPAGTSANALLAMVEAQVVREVVVGGSDAAQTARVLAELWWRAVYSRPNE